MASNTIIQILKEGEELSCCFEYYSKESGGMVPCDKKAVAKYGASGKKGLCRDCAVNARLINGNAVRARNGEMFMTIEEALEAK